jgi:uncharacterized protein YabN with tetrapyrrole methylase and pyrophosphatase domain
MIVSDATWFWDLVDRAGRESLPDIWVIGLGVRVPGHLTTEAIEALRTCRRVYTALPAGYLASALPEPAPPVDSLYDRFVPGQLRTDAYRSIVDTVVQAAAREPPVGYLTTGNPIIFDQITTGILAAAEDSQQVARVLPGVSSIDSVLVHLRHDIGRTGVQMFEATWLVVHRIQPRADIPCLLLGVNSFGTNFPIGDHEPRPEALAPLRDHLLQTYPPDHEVVFVQSPTWWHEREQFLRVPLDRLGREDGPSEYGATLFVPRASAPRPDPVLAERVRDPTYFARVYRPIR